MKEQIEQLMQEHGLSGLYLGGAGDAGVTEEADQWVLKFGDMPQLSFFVDLAALCRVPITSIATDSEDHGGGCDTCGYGAGSEITARVPKTTQGKPTDEVMK